MVNSSSLERFVDLASEALSEVNRLQESGAAVGGKALRLLYVEQGGRSSILYGLFFDEQILGDRKLKIVDFSDGLNGNGLNLLNSNAPTT